jgi:uncharacterized protein (UPF0332 family)
MNGDAFFLLASQWVSPDKSSVSEPLCRSAVSRAYYGVFHIARSLLNQMGFMFKNENEHDRIPQDLMNCGDDDAFEAGRLLGDLRSERNSADYDIEDPQYGKLEYARMQVATALDIKGILSALSREPKREAVRKGIKAYRRIRNA